jgi:hypothetical protein
MDDLKYLADWLSKAKCPEDVFGVLLGRDSIAKLEEIRVKHNTIAKDLHPDRHNGSKQAHDAMASLNVWRTKAEEKIVQDRWGRVDSGVSIQAGKLYKNIVHLATGDVCDVYLAEQENGPRAIIKIAIDTKDQDLVQNEAIVLKKLWEPKDKESVHFQQYLPKLLEQTKVKVAGKEQIANIIQVCEQGYTLEQVHQKYPVLDARNVAWIWKRILECIGWVNLKQKIIHGAILPSHVILYPKNHGACIIDWSYAAPVKSPLKAISEKYKNFYPPEVFTKTPAHMGIDIFMAAKCALYLLGGNTQTNFIPEDTTPPLMKGFLQACLLNNIAARYTDTWEALEQLDDNLRIVFGPKKFVTLEM